MCGTIERIVSLSTSALLSWHYEYSQLSVGTSANRLSALEKGRVLNLTLVTESVNVKIFLRWVTRAYF